MRNNEAGQILGHNRFANYERAFDSMEIGRYEKRVKSGHTKTTT